MKIKLLVLSLIIVLFGGTGNLYADWRGYVWTYEYITMPKGMAELEYYLTTIVPDADESDINTWKHWIELEYGITNRWDISIYQQFKQSNKTSESDFEYDGFKIRTRYRIGEKGKFLLDPLLYFEYIRNDNLSKPNVFEGKLILAKDIDKFNFSYNQILKQELEGGGETEHEYAFGINYEISPRFKLGLESKGNYTKEKYYVGPTISLATERFWTSFGVALGVNDRSDDLQTRIIVGIPF